MPVSDFTIAVSALTAVVSRSGAAPVSSARLWQAAKVAAAARIQRVFMISPSGDRSPARWGVVADVRQLRAFYAKLKAEAPRYPRFAPLTRSQITIFRVFTVRSGGLPGPGTGPGRPDWPRRPRFSRGGRGRRPERPAR